MFHLTIFGGAEASMDPAGSTALTLFGFTNLRSPTMAQQVVQMKAERERPRPRWEKVLGSGRSLAITLFGGTEIQRPTLVEEFSALRALVNNGTLTREECASYAERLGAQKKGELLTTVTLFGGCSFSRPSPKQERKALEAAERGGMIERSVREQLDSIVGSDEPTMIETVKRLVLA